MRGYPRNLHINLHAHPLAGEAVAQLFDDQRHRALIGYESRRYAHCSADFFAPKMAIVD